jgi:hypothetical protein
MDVNVEESWLIEVVMVLNYKIGQIPFYIPGSSN